MATALQRLLPELRACVRCEPALPLGAKPIFQLDRRAPILIASQAPGRIALLRLDTDWYESTYHELEHLWPRLVEGGVLIIDDYGHWQGTRRAVDEYFARHRIASPLHAIDYTGRLVVKASRAA